MVFAESIPESIREAARLRDPNTPPAEKQRIEDALKKSAGTVEADADRINNSDRHTMNRAKRAKVMADLRRDARGKPKYGETKRLANLHDVPVRQVRKWIEQIQRGEQAPAPSTSRYQLPTTDWQTVYRGKAIRHRNADAGRKRQKRKD